MATDEDDVGARLRDSLSRAAARAYEAAHGNPLPTEARGVRFALEPRAAVAVALALVTAGVMILLQVGSPAVPVPVVSLSSGPGGGLGDVVVHVAGAVAQPGVVTLDGGARVADAVVAAGGFAADADEGALNLARVVRDGEQVFVPVSGGERDARVNINRATSAQLEALPGIGPVLADRIVADRAAHGSFLSLEDLGRVKGVGDDVIEAIAALATV